MTILIAHRGASGYVPEHTLCSVALAYGLGADFIEQDIVLSKDNHPIVLHDIHLDQVTNVAEIYPDRKRSDGHWYAIDFLLAELKQLGVHERGLMDNSGPVYPKRFPYKLGQFEIPTLQEEIDLIKGLNQSTGKNVGIYPEIKKPAWHQQEGADITQFTLEILTKNNYQTIADNIYLQCFDSSELKRVKDQFKSSLPLIQLIGKNSWRESTDDYDKMISEQGCREIANYAVGIGPALDLLFITSSVDNAIVPSRLSIYAKNYNLMMHPFTFRKDSFPLVFATYQEMIAWFANELNVDGLFTDFVDVTQELLAASKE